MKSKKFIIIWLTIISISLITMGTLVYIVDPFFHYRRPNVERFYYSLYNQRSQNNGILKYFDYDAIIIGTSMTENFKKSEMDQIFEANSIKVPFSGASYKEINDNIKIAFDNVEIKTIIRCLDMSALLDDKDKMRYDLGQYPIYLYDDNILNDYKYLCCKEVFINRVLENIIYKNDVCHKIGITSFDDYSNWHNNSSFGRKVVIPYGFKVDKSKEYKHLTQEDKEKIKLNIEQNVISLANEHKNVDYYCFLPPYSIVWWGGAC